MDTFLDILIWLLVAVVITAIFNSNSKGKSSRDDDYEELTLCFCHMDTPVTCYVCTREEAKANLKKYGKRTIIN